MYDPLRAKIKVAFATAVAVLLGLGIASGLGWTGTTHAMPVIDTSPQVSPAAVRPALDLSEAFVNISDAVTPAVVRIEVRRPPDAQRQRGTIPEIFRNRLPEPDPDGEVPDMVGGGSGFIVSDDGYILTNNHVVEGASEITVFLSDRRAYGAELVGGDPFTDVAVVKIEDDDPFQPMSFGNSDGVDVGEWVVAIGNPGFGSGTTLDYSVTTGIVSAKGRPLQLLQRELFRDDATRADRGFAIEHFIQTDAVINPGNSGGPMVNLRGQVIGINSAIASPTGFYQGYGFAIPINLARRVMEDLIDYGEVHRPWLGVRLGAIDAISAEFYGLPAVSGVEIEGVTEQPRPGPALAAGVRAGDVIWAVDGQMVATQSALQQTIMRRRPGDVVRLTLYRNRRIIELDVELGQIELRGERSARGPTGRASRGLGIEFGTFGRQQARELGLNGRDGVYVTDVEVDGAAFRRRVLVGYRVVDINGVTVESPVQARELVAAMEPGEIVSLRLADPSGQPATFHIRMPG